MAKITTTAIAAAIICGASLASVGANAAVPSPTAAVSQASTAPTWVKMMKKKHMMKKKMMKKKMM